MLLLAEACLTLLRLCQEWLAKSKVNRADLPMEWVGDRVRHLHHALVGYFSAVEFFPCAGVAMLIVLGGLPGTGKTTLARELAQRLSAMYLRIDTVEQAIITSRLLLDAGPAGYFVGYSVAADNLSLGLTVVADSVNSLAVTRDAWFEVAKTTGAAFVEIEVICSDSVEHRRRVELRTADISGHKLPSWQDVLNRPYDPWTRKRIVIDTAALSIMQAVDDVIEHLSTMSMHASPRQS